MTIQEKRLSDELSEAVFRDGSVFLVARAQGAQLVLAGHQPGERCLVRSDIEGLWMGAWRRPTLLWAEGRGQTRSIDALALYEAYEHLLKTIGADRTETAVSPQAVKRPRKVSL